MLFPLFFLPILCVSLSEPPNFRIPSLFLSENETLNIQLRDFLPKSYPKIALAGATNQFFTIETFENLEEIDQYSFESSSSLQKAKFLKEIHGFFLLFAEKCSVFFLEKHNEKFLKIVDNTKLKYAISQENDEKHEIFTCFDVVFLEELREFLFDCDWTAENSTKSVFLTYFLQENRQFILKNSTILEENTRFLECKRLLQRENGRLFRRCARNSNVSKAIYYEIFDIALTNNSFYEISLRTRVNVRDFSRDGRSFVVDAWAIDNFEGNLNKSVETPENLNKSIGFNETFNKINGTIENINKINETLNKTNETLNKIQEIPTLLLISTNNSLLLLNFSRNTTKLLKKQKFSNETLLKLHKIIYADPTNSLQFLILSKKSVYFLRMTPENSSNFLEISHIISLKEASIPLNLHYTREHLLVEYKYFIKIYKYSQKSFEITDVFHHYFSENRVFLYFLSVLFIEDVEIIGVLSRTSAFHSDFFSIPLISQEKTTWLLNFSQIFQRFFKLRYSPSYFSLSPRSSLDNSNVSLLINDQYLLNIAVFFWNLSDTRLYFFKTLRKPDYFLLKSETFAMNLENYIIGALPKAILTRSFPIKQPFSIKDSSSWTFDYSSLIKENLAFSPTNFLRDTLFLYMEAFASSLSFIWQSSHTNYVSLINCFEIKENLISDCVVLTKFSLKVPLVKTLRHKNLFWLLDQSKKVYFLDESAENPEVKPVSLYEILCEDFEIHGEFRLFFCVNHQRSLVDIYSFKETGDLWEILAKHETFRIKNLVIDQLFIEFFNMGCLIVKSAKLLYFIEIISDFSIEFPTENSEKVFQFVVKTAMPIDSESYSVFLINTQFLERKMLIVDYSQHNIMEFSLINPLNPQFSRKYPVLDYKIRFSVLNSNRYLGIVARNPVDNSEYFMFYDVREFSGGVLKRKANLEPGCLKYNVILMSENVVRLENSKVYALLLVIKENEISFKTIENIKLTGSLKNLYNFPELFSLENRRFLTFSFILYFYNVFHAEKVYHLLNITVIPSDMFILSQGNQRKIDVFQSFSNGFYTYSLQEQVFQGPVTNYMLINEKNVENSNFNAFLSPTPHFVDYHRKIEHYGNVISMDFCGNGRIFVVLTEKVLTFFDILEDYRVIYQYKIEESFNCSSIEQHKSRDFLVIFCKFTENYSTPALYLHFFFYSYKRKGQSTGKNAKKPDNIINNSTTNVFDDLNEENFTVNTKDFTFSVQKILYKNGDSELMDNNFVSSELVGDHLFILAKEYYSYINSIYIFQIPSETNNFSLFCKGKIELFEEIPTNSEEYLFFSSENLTLIDGQVNIIDFIVYESNKTVTNREILTLGLLILNENQGSFFEYTINRSSVEECFPLKYDRKFLIDFYRLLEFDENIVNSIKLLTYSLIDVRELLPNLTRIRFLLTTNLEIFELELLIFEKNFTLNQIYSYRRFFSCSFVASMPIKLGNFLGAFCEKDSNEIRNYFVLYKQSLNNKKFSHPIRSLPLLIGLFEVIFFESQGNYAVILPSYLNVFQEYVLDVNLTIFKSKKPLENTNVYSLVAYNDLSKTFCEVRINIAADSSKNIVIFIVILLVLVIVLLIILSIFAYIVYLKRKKKKNNLIFNEDMKVFLETWAEFNKKRDESLHSTMTASCEPSSIATSNAHRAKKILVYGDNLENSIKHSKKSDRYSVEVEVKKKIKNFNKNF